MNKRKVSKQSLFFLLLKGLTYKEIDQYLDKKL